MIPTTRCAIIAVLALFFSSCGQASSDPPEGEDRPPLVPAEQLTQTDVLPHLDGPIVPGRTCVYCATFQIAWDELRKDMPEGRWLLDEEPEMAKALNDNPFDRTHLNPASYLAMAGRTDQGIVDEIRRQMKSRFPHATLAVPDPPSGTAVYVFAYLAKTLTFPGRFDRLARPLEFRFAGQSVNVNTFGANTFLGGTELGDARSKQVRVLDYRSDDDFILSLSTSDHERIVLAKVQPRKTLRETMQAVGQRIRSATMKQWMEEPQMDECLRVPIIKIDVQRSYRELVGRRLGNRGWEGNTILDALQAIRFRLDERGARLESSTSASISPAPPPRPRQFVFDTPFLIYLQESSDAAPYFAVWVGSGDLLERFNSR